MAYKNFTAVNTVQAINNQIQKQYPITFPAINQSNFSDMASALRTASGPVQNAWQDELVNMIKDNILKNKRTYESYYRKLHLAPIPGFEYQLQMIDLIEARAYSPDADADDFFADEKPDVATQYVNYPQKFKFAVSVNIENLTAAFTSEARFMDFVGQIEANMYNSMEMSDVKTVNYMISQNIEQGNIFLVPMAKPVDQTTALAFTAQLKALAEDMAVELSPEYNLSGFNTFVPRDEGIVITDTDTKAVTETYSLAWAFNREFLDLQQGGQAITMKANSICGGKVFALYGDRYAFEIRNIEGFPQTRYQEFGNTLTTKRWLHYWAQYTMSYFNAMAAFADSTAIDSNPTIALGLADGTTAVNKGVKNQVKVSTFTPTTGKIFDKFGSYELSGETSDNTIIDQYSGKIKVGKDETGSDVSGLTGKYITVTWTSHLNANVTATLNIKINS